ncbi:MAG: hypothetical protein AAGA68_10235 [Pseudomonadota bacterium]
MTYTWFDFVGNLGVMLVLLTYAMVQLGRLGATSVTYGSLNAVGAVLILVSLSNTFNLSSFVIEICWLTISLIGVTRTLWRRHRARREHAP